MSLGILVGNIDDGQCEFALLHVVAGRFAHIVLVVVIKDVVLQLEAYTEKHAKALHSIYVSGMIRSKQGTHLGTGREERGGLLAHHLVVRALPYFLAVHVGQLQKFAIR